MDDTKSEAVIVYVSGRPNPSPREDPEAVAHRFGDDAPDLVVYARSVVAAYFDAGRPLLATKPLLEAIRHADGAIRQLHPELSDAAVHELGRLFGYAYK